MYIPSNFYARNTAAIRARADLMSTIPSFLDPGIIAKTILKILFLHESIGFYVE